MPKQNIPAPFTRSPLPLIEGGGARYLQVELGRVQDSINSMVWRLPQPATEAPKKLIDGMIRLARAPWWPASGQSADAWVWYDATTSTWKLI